MLSVSEIRTLIKERPGISLRDLALHFRVSPGMMEMMVSKLVDRGDVEPSCRHPAAAATAAAHPRTMASITSSR